MSYIGNTPTLGHFPTDTFTSVGGSTYTLSQSPSTAGAIEVSVQGVLQAVSAYSVDGTTLTLAGVATDDIIFVRHLGETLLVPIPVDGSVTTASIVADAVDGTKIADNAIDSEHYTDASIDNAHLADDAVGLAELSATGTPTSSTFLRGDNSWQTAGSTSASDLTSGTLPDARFPAALPAISGAALTNLPAAGFGVLHIQVFS